MTHPKWNPVGVSIVGTEDIVMSVNDAGALTIKYTRWDKPERDATIVLQPDDVDILHELLTASIRGEQAS